jgi:hypothetical protein
MSSYEVYGAQRTNIESKPYCRPEYSSWVLVGTEKKGDQVESTYTNTSADPEKPITLRVGVYNKPATGFDGRQNISVKLSTWCKITDDDSFIHWKEHTFTIAVSGPYGAALAANYAVAMLENALGFIMPLEATPVTEAWTSKDETFTAALAAGVTEIDFSDLSDSPS